MTPEEKFKLITRDLQEVVDQDKIKEIVKKRDLKVYWGTAPTGKPHLGYFVPLLKIGDLLKAGCEVTILFADLHAYLDNMKSNWELLDHRTKYYEFVIKEMLKIVDVPLKKLKFVKGTDFQLKKDYSLDVYKMAALASTRDTIKAGAEVVKQIETPKLSGLLYPILQALDEVYLKVDAQFGGIDQRKIFMFAREFLPKINYSKRIHLMNYLIPGLTQSGKMSSSEPNSKIDLDDDEKTIRKKINKAYSIDGQTQNNGLLAIARFIIFKVLEHQKKSFIINRPEKWGGKIEFRTYQDLETSFAKKELASADLKQGLAEEIIQLLKTFKTKQKELEKLSKAAYP